MAKNSNSELEVVGQILSDASKLLDCDLTPGDFINSQYREIYSTILELSESGAVIDPISVSDRLQLKTGQDWLKICGRAANDAFCHRTFRNQVDMVRKKGQLHRAKSILNYTVNLVEQSDNVDCIDRAIEELMMIQSTRVNHMHSLSECVSKTIQRLESMHGHEGLVGLSTGLTDLDEVTNGFHNTDLIVIGARPAMGKTALLLNLAYAGSAHGPVGIISSEQAGEQVGDRFVSIAGMVDSRKIRSAKLAQTDWEKITSTAAHLHERPVWIYDEDRVDIGTLMRVAREWKYRYGIKALYVDYLQIIKPSSPHFKKSDAVGEVAERLKGLAKQLVIPVVALAQVAREVEKREDRRPGQADLSDSSEVEKNADMIMTIYRDEVYNTTTQFPGVAELIICKSRHGPTGTVHTKWEGKYLRFSNLNSKA